MSGKMKWIVIGVAAGIGLAILIGVLGTRNEPSSSSVSKTQAASALCSSLKDLGTSIQTLVGLGTSGSKSDYQSDVNAVENNWSQVQSDYNTLQEAEPGQLSSAWSAFESAVKAVPSADSVSDAVSSITSSADALKSAAQSTVSSLSCS
jgi:hypothetical protein